jgi:hypothetical protein
VTDIEGLPIDEEAHQAALAKRVDRAVPLPYASDSFTGRKPSNEDRTLNETGPSGPIRGGGGGGEGSLSGDSRSRSGSRRQGGAAGFG